VVFKDMSYSINRERERERDKGEGETASKSKRTRKEEKVCERERDRESEKEGSTMEIAGEGAGEIQRGRDVRMGWVTAGKQNKTNCCNMTQIGGHNHVPTQVPDPNPPPCTCMH